MVTSPSPPHHMGTEKACLEWKEQLENKKKKERKKMDLSPHVGCCVSPTVERLFHG